MHGKLLTTARKIAHTAIPNSVRNTEAYQALRRQFDDMGDQTQHRVSSYPSVEDLTAQSADAIATSIFRQFHPRSVVDVGCGTGALLGAFRHHGCQIKGVEFANAGIEYFSLKGIDVTRFDLRSNASVSISPVNLAVSFAVTEHLPVRVANRYVDLLCSLASQIVISAAAPQQGGQDHANEHSHSFWIEEFASRGYCWDKEVSLKFSRDWRSAGVAPFYFQNVMMFS